MGRGQGALRGVRPHAAGERRLCRVGLHLLGGEGQGALRGVRPHAAGAARFCSSLCKLNRLEGRGEHCEEGGRMLQASAGCDCLQSQPASWEERDKEHYNHGRRRTRSTTIIVLLEQDWPAEGRRGTRSTARRAAARCRRRPAAAGYKPTDASKPPYTDSWRSAAAYCSVYSKIVNCLQQD